MSTRVLSICAVISDSVAAKPTEILSGTLLYFEITKVCEGTRKKKPFLKITPSVVVNA